jgi:hypothetical protein
MEKFGEAILTNVKETTLGELTDGDWVGHEKFPNEIIDKNTKVKIIKFNFKKI